MDEGKECGGGLDDCHGVCAICLEKIPLEETALVKGCEHAYWFVLDDSYVLYRESAFFFFLALVLRCLSMVLFLSALYD